MASRHNRWIFVFSCCCCWPAQYTIKWPSSSFLQPNKVQIIIFYSKQMPRMTCTSPIQIHSPNCISIIWPASIVIIIIGQQNQSLAHSKYNSYIIRDATPQELHATAIHCIPMGTYERVGTRHPYHHHHDQCPLVYWLPRSINPLKCPPWYLLANISMPAYALGQSKGEDDVAVLKLQLTDINISI